MPLIRPRLTDHFGVSLAQEEVDFAIPFLDEDLPLYVDPFLLWKSPSQQDQALHGSMLSAFNRIGRLASRGDIATARNLVVRLSECDEIGLGGSATRQGKRVSEQTADQIIELFQQIPKYTRDGLSHIEELQLFIGGISKDRISDIAGNLLKSFLIDYTIEQGEKIGLPLSPSTIPEMYDHRSHRLVEQINLPLPTHPITGRPILLVPRRWLRHSPWISFEDYFKVYIPKDDRYNKVTWDRVPLLNFNRENYDVVQSYVSQKETRSTDCRSDPLFKQIPVLSAKRKFSEIQKIPTGKDNNADKQYEDAAISLISSMFYPHLDYADDQVRTDSGAQIRDLIFYMNRNVDFLSDIYDDYGSRQLVFEIKNVKKIEREHINQLNRYLSDEFGKFGVLVTRNPLPRAMRQNTIDLWSGQRRCLLPLTDTDLGMMVNLFEQHRKPPIDVLKRSYLQFKRECPA